jgi:acetamidase/formamidase
MTLLFEVDRSTALALASVAVSLRVTQVVNKTWGVHAFLADGSLRQVHQSA